jgi:hypothetical protein
MVIRELVGMLGHRHKDNTELALNSSTVLMELIEIDKTFELFFKDDGSIIA